MTWFDDLLSNKKFQQILTELFMRGRKFQTSESLNKSHLIVHQILTLKSYKICTAKPYSFLMSDTALALDNPLHSIKNTKNNHGNRW